MSLGLPSLGELKPIVKYDARAGRIFRIDRPEGGSSTPVEITNGFKAVFDLANIEVGYVRFMEGGAPEWAMVKLGQQLPPRPSKEFRQGFRMNIKLPAALGGDTREFASAAGCVVSAIDALHTTYQSAPEAKAGKLPIVAMTGADVVRSGQSTNYAPKFSIIGWVDKSANGNGSPTPPPAPPPPAPDLDDDIPFSAGDRSKIAA